MEDKEYIGLMKHCLLHEFTRGFANAVSVKNVVY